MFGVVIKYAHNMAISCVKIWVQCVDSDMDMRNLEIYFSVDDYGFNTERQTKGYYGSHM